MLEQLTEKFKVRGCHLLADLEYSYKSDYISELFLKPSSERSQLVEWAFSQIDPELERIHPAERLTMLGICNSSEAASFSSAVMCRNNQLKIWSHIVDLLSTLEEHEAIDEIKQEQSPSSKFIDALAEQVNFDELSRCELDIFPVHFARELKRKSQLQNCGMPSVSQLESTLKSGQETYKALERFKEDQVGSTAEDEESLARVEEMTSQVEVRCEELRGKHQAEFSSWLQPSNLSAGPSDSRAGPVLGSEATLQVVEKYLTSCVLIAQSTERLLEVGQTDLKDFNSSSNDVLAGLDNLTIAEHNLSRAPAAS